MTKDSFIEKQEANLSIHIFTVSATMVGICLTVIGIINLLAFGKKAETIVDDILATDAILFLAACIISYFAIKMENKELRLKLEKFADTIFLSAIGIMTLVCFFIVFKR